VALILAAVVLMPACGTAKRTLRIEEPGLLLQWPFQPNRAKLTLLYSINGFVPDKRFRDKMKAVVVGTATADEDAFVLPVAVATGADGRIAVADMGRACVHLYVPSEQRYVRITGSKQERIRTPVGVVFDGSLRLYVSDSTGAVFAFDRDGGFLFTLTQAGSSRLERPTGLAYSPSRELLYVVDTLANRVHAFGPAGDLVFSFGERGAEEGSFNFPTHIFRSTSGELYIADSLNFRIGIFDETGRPLGSFGRQGDGSGELAMPKGLAVDSDGVIYVVDSLFDHVQLFDRQGEFLLTLGGRGVDFGEFWLPAGAFIDENGLLYVCDTYNRRVQVFRITEGYNESGS